MKFGFNLSFALLLILQFTTTVSAQTADPPQSPVKLIFIHHSTGGNWLADDNPDETSGGLGTALMNNNYYVSATNYCWGLNQVGSRTNIVHWPEWFTGPNRDTIMTAVYSETGQNFEDCDNNSFGAWTRTGADPGGENQIVLLKSCFPNSDLYGNPTDPAGETPNDQFTNSNAKAVYNNILTYFTTRQDKLFVVITAPPMSETTYTINDVNTPAADRAANARAFNTWLVNDWLSGYSHQNVVVFDYYNILTSNGGDANTNDAGQETGNHHRWHNNQEQHIMNTPNNYAAYPYFVGVDWTDDHPTSAGHRKAAAEFVPLLNYYYNRWKEGGSTVVPGNVNASPDGVVNLLDQMTALQVCAGNAPTLVDPAAEINQDQHVGLAEAVFAGQVAAADPGLVYPRDLIYLGAFRLPDAFNWGARGMSYYPDGANGSGSLLITASEALRTPDGTSCYEGLTDCAAYFAEVAIPDPVKADQWNTLPEVAFLTQPAIFDGGLVQTVHPAHAFVTGIQYVPKHGTQAADKIYGALNEWYPEGGFGDNNLPTIWFSNLDGSNAKGVFHVGPEANPLYHGRKMGDFLFTLPTWYADQYLGGRTLVTGRSRGTPAGVNPELTTQGGSQGPTLFAFKPLTSDNPPDTQELDALPMLYYRVKYPACAGPDIGAGGTPVDCDYPGFSMCDSWSGGSFIGSRDKNAIILLGHKGATNCYYCDEQGADPECHVSPAPAECARYCNEDRGFHCDPPYQRQIIFYDTAELASSAQGGISPWEIIPYEIWQPAVFFLNGENVCGDVGGMAYDDVTRRLFVIERGLGGHQGDNAAVVHVWQIN